MKILITGGSGFLGSHLCDLLSSEGHEVTIFDIKKSKYIRKDQKMYLGSVRRCHCKFYSSNPCYFCSWIIFFR